MKIKLRRIGNSMGVILPIGLAELYKETGYIDLIVRDGDEIYDFRVVDEAPLEKPQKNGSKSIHTEAKGAEEKREAGASEAPETRRASEGDSVQMEGKKTTLGEG